MGELVFGFAGDWHLGLAIRHRFAPPAIGKGDLDCYMNTLFIDALGELFDNEGMRFPKDGQLIVGARGELYEIDRGLAAIRSGGYNAIGCGSFVAMGSLHTTTEAQITPQERLRLALEAAADLVPGVCPPFIYAENMRTRPSKTHLAVVKAR
jgi:hypothetical protein